VEVFSGGEGDLMEEVIFTGGGRVETYTKGGASRFRRVRRRCLLDGLGVVRGAG
jgi:hypothetical protein